jgi:starch phosphorylase
VIRPNNFLVFSYMSQENQAALSGLDGYSLLLELALDLRWSWNHGTDTLWNQLDPVLWDLTRNPWTILQTISPEKLKFWLSNSKFRREVDNHIDAKKRALESNAWFQKNHRQSPLTSIAYFSMEFMLSEALPIYSGGLGNVAGDQLKAANDLGVPVVGVGLLFQQGYFRQMIDQNGEQQALYPYNDPGQLPITPLRGTDGAWLRLEIALPGYSLWLRAWEVQVGRVRLYLLDSNDPSNFPVHRGITSELYGGNPELRLKQELILGIGGWRLLEALDCQPQVCHLNEGHAAFAVLERARSFMQRSGQPFDAGLAVTRVGNLFTTHTAVEAGFDRFAPDLMEHYLAAYAREKLGISFRDLMALGRQNPDNDVEPFNMAYLALRGSGAVNGVSRLHGQVSRRLFTPLFPRWPEDEVPIGFVTNGVHMPTWDSVAADDLWTSACGKDRWQGMTSTLEEDIDNVPDETLWQMRSANRQSLIDYLRLHLPRQLSASGASLDVVESAKYLFDSNVLTLGFARRFATYKRPNLLLHDPERLLQLLTNPERRVQLIMAGKAHPADRPGQALIREWMQFIERPEVRPHVIFLSDYDMLLAQRLVQGVDVWINTPQRPWEASGTSGMKVLVNGGINLSELDGWWAEAYLPNLGWALGDGNEHGSDPSWDTTEANALYDLLEREVMPEFYDRNDQQIPKAWVARMRRSMARLTPNFSASRTVRDYTEQYYIPAAANYQRRVAQNGAFGAYFAKWKQDLEEKWPSLRFGKIAIETLGNEHRFAIQVFLHGLHPDAVRVELYADRKDGEAAIRQEMKRDGPPGGEVIGDRYSGSVPATRPATDFTPRIVAAGNDIAVPLEEERILWGH